MGKVHRIGLVLLVTAALVASGVTVALAEGLVQDVFEGIVSDEGQQDVDAFDEASEPESAAEETSSIEAIEGSDTDSEPADDEEGTEEGLSDDGALEAEGEAEEPIVMDMGWFTVLVGSDGMTLTILADGSEGSEDEVFEIPLTRTNNHGAYVSAMAKGAPKGPGHGELVGSIAHSTLGKKNVTEDSVEDADPVVDADDPIEIEDAHDAGEGEDSSALSIGGKDKGKGKGLNKSTKMAGKSSGKKK